VRRTAIFKQQNVIRRVNADMLLAEHQKQSRRKVTGIDRATKDEYGESIARNITNLLERMKLFQYRPQPVRRTYILKANGKLRPLRIPA
jgi:retron-type reverse transcriptase